MIAPRFVLASDGAVAGVLHWERNNDWKEGGESAETRGVSLSAFAVLDRLRARLGRPGLYPNLTHMVIVGHSAGGQFVQRYALGTQAAPAGTGRSLEVLSTQPGQQHYSGNFLDGSLIGREGIAYHRWQAFCLEAQHFPDTPNHPSFPSAVLEPGEVYAHSVVYRFGVSG